jgi:hypothetical protein
MARGWESKSCEDQQDAAAARKAVAEKPSLSEADAARRQQVEALRLSRARVLSDLQRACRPEHRGMLEQALADIEARLAAQEA